MACEPSSRDCRPVSLSLRTKDGVELDGLSRWRPQTRSRGFREKWRAYAGTQGGGSNCGLFRGCCCCCCCCALESCQAGGRVDTRLDLETHVAGLTVQNGLAREGHVVVWLLHGRRRIQNQNVDRKRG